MTYKPHPMDVCNMFDTTNKTIAQVARHFGLTSAEVKNILLDVTDEQATALQRERGY
jgi:hypothetical protein